MKKEIEKDKQENKNTKIIKNNKAPNIILRILCLLLPVIFAFGGYFLAPGIWILLNNNTPVPEHFRFASSIIFFLIPSTIIFLHTRKLNPTINITIKDKNREN